MSARIGLLVRRPGVRVVAGLWILASVGTLFLPMAGRPGYANALAANLLVGLLGLVVGAGAARVEQDIADVRTHPGIPLNLKRPPGAVRAVAIPVLSATGVLTGLVGVTLLAALINGLRVGTCDLAADLLWYPVLPLVSVPLAAVCGVGLGAVSRHRVVAALLGLGLVLATVAASAWPVLTGPQAFVYNHLLGYLPGPLYDERVAVTGAVLGYRALTLAWAALAAGLLALLVDDASLRVRLGLGGGRLGAGILVLVAAVAVGGLQANRTRLGFYENDASVARALGGVTRTPHFVIHYPRGESARWVRRMAEEHEFRYHQLIRWMKLPEGTAAPVTSWIFASAAQKRRLIGAGQTDIAKPWLHALFIDADGFPPPVLKHELAHVLASAFGRGPFEVASSDGLIPNQGFEEGLAVAASWPSRGPLTIHGWARAMRALGVAPPIGHLFSSAGFLTQAPSRAYTLAGSFIRWLVATRGIDAVKRAYRAGDLRKIGDPRELFHAWGAFLDARPVSPLARRLAEARFRRPSIVLRPCAFDVTRALARARADLDAGRTAAGLRWIHRCIALEPDAPWHLRTLLDAELRVGHNAAAKRTAEKLLHHPKADPSLKSQAELALGNLAWEAGDTAAAVKAYQAVVSFGVDAGLVRLATASMIAATDPVLTPVVRPLLLGRTPRALALLDLAQLVQKAPKAPLPRYLLGRQLYNLGDFDRALPWLEQANDLGLTPRGGLAVENLRLIARAEWEAGHLKAAVTAWQAVRDHPAVTPGRRLDATDWIARCRFDETWRAAHRR